MIYFDNSATTRITEPVKKRMKTELDSLMGNPSSLHRLGVESEKKIRVAASYISKEIGCLEKEVYITSGGTEANNLAILGYARRNKKKGMHLITSSYEHSAVLEAFKALGNEGFEVSFIKPDKDGLISPESVLRELRDDTILVSIMHVNNETGAINNIMKIAEDIRTSKAAFHVDAVQSFCKFDINVSRMEIDMLSMSGHKIGAPKGVGALYVKNGLALKPLVFGGQQQGSLRPGTENMLGIAAFGEAIKTYKREYEKVSKIYQAMREGLIELGAEVISGKENYSPYILSVSFKGYLSEVLLHTFESSGLFVSTGSACNSKKKTYSHALSSYIEDEEVLKSAVRFSFSSENSLEEVNKAIAIIRKSLEMLKGIMGR